jgi:hypothetical protein
MASMPYIDIRGALKGEGNLPDIKQIPGRVCDV